MSNGKFQALLSNSPEEIIRWQAEILQLTHEAIIVHHIEDGRVIFWNRGATELYGWSEKEAVGKITHELLETRFPPALGEILDRVCSAGQWNGELIHTTQDGRQIIVASRWTSRRDLKGNIKDIVELNFDITANKKAERHAQEREHLASLGAAAAVLAHELANPLSGISISAQSLEMRMRQRNERDSELACWIEDLNQEIKRFASLLHDFRSLARPPKLDLQSGDLVRLIEEILIFEEPVCRTAGVSIKRVYRPLPAIKMDCNKLKQAIWNILKNAVEAMPTRGQLTIKTYAAEDRVCLEVTDTGVGIEEGLDVFGMFKTTKSDGTGLGLPFVKQIVSAHRGTLDYASEPGIGTTFKISLPIRGPLFS